MNAPSLEAVQRETTAIEHMAAWLKLRAYRDEANQIRVDVTLQGSFAADPADLEGSIVREIHRRLEDFESKLDE